MSSDGNAALRFDWRGARTRVLWPVTQAGRVMRCGFHSTPAWLIDCACDLYSALRNIVRDDSDGPDSGLRLLIPSPFGSDQFAAR